jgi:hypothetical protein
MSLARAIDLRPEDLAGRTWTGYLRRARNILTEFGTLWRNPAFQIAAVHPIPNENARLLGARGHPRSTVDDATRGGPGWGERT